MHQARINELGKVAALQYETFLSKKKPFAEDYSTSIKRHYLRQSLLSTLRPMLIFVQVDVTKMNVSSQAPFLADLVTSCNKHSIDGIVLRQTTFDEDARSALETVNKADKSG